MDGQAGRQIDKRGKKGQERQRTEVYQSRAFVWAKKPPKSW